MKPYKHFLVCILIAVFPTLLLQGCATKKLWSEATAKEYIKIVPQHKSDDVEIALKASGKNYYCQELYASSYPNNKICYMEKSEALKLQQKIIYTPKALATDILAPVLLTTYFVGSMILGIEMVEAQREQAAKQSENPSGL